MLLSEFINNLQEIFDQQGDGTIVIDVPERIGFASSIDIRDENYQGNYRALEIGESRKPYCFLIIEEGWDDE